MSFCNLLMKTGVNGSLRRTQTPSALQPLLLLNVSQRQGHTLRGKPPGVARTLEQRLRGEFDVVINVQLINLLIGPALDEDTSDPEITARINIGFPQLKQSRSAQLQARLEHLKAQRASKELEQLARSNKCE